MRYTDPSGLMPSDNKPTMVDPGDLTTPVHNISDDSPCMQACSRKCKQSLVTGPPDGSFIVELVDQACMSRCRLVCSNGSSSNLCGCTPTGTLTIAPSPPPSAGSPGFAPGISIVGEDPNCCSEFSVIQFRRTKGYWGGWSEWDIDDGNDPNNILSNPSPDTPYYAPPSKINPKGTGGPSGFQDDPGNLVTPKSYDFIVLVICSKGPAAGHRYGTFGWTYANGWWGGTVTPPTMTPGLAPSVPKQYQ